MDELSLKITDPKVHFKEPVKTETRFNDSDKRKLAKASKDFESLLTGLMIKSMTKNTDGMFGKDNYGGDVLDVLFETEIAKHITNSKGMGIADKIYKSVTGEALEKTKKNENLIDNSIEKKNISNIPVKIDSKITPSAEAIQRLKKYEKIIHEASEKFSVDKKLIKSVILTESAAKANAKSNANAKGLMQLIDSTATEMGVVNIWNPKENINGGTKYLSALLKIFDGDTNLALAAYNAGPSNVKKFNGIPPFKETQNYVKRVNEYLNIME